MKSWMHSTDKLGVFALLRLGLVIFSLVILIVSPTSDRMNLFIQIVMTFILFIHGVDDLLKWIKLRNIKNTISHEKDL
jgi:uncharacterized protein YhhL (DUF1145 family)